MAAILIICLVGGCSSSGRSLSLSFGGLNYHTSPAGLQAMLRDLRQMSAGDQLRNLRAFAGSSTGDLKCQASYVLGRKLQASTSDGDIREAISCFRQAQALSALAPRCRL